MLRSTTPTKVARSEERGYAAGWWVNRQADGSLVDPALPEDTYWASGHDGQRLYVVPSARLVVARLGFSPEVEAEDLRTVELVADLVRQGAGG
jgi:CubicO group peptidase (beta-lactamase class C family)